MPLRLPTHVDCGSRGATLAHLEPTQFKFWLDNAPDGILCSNAKGRIIYANQAILALLGYSEQEFVQLHVADTYDQAESHVAQTRLLAPEVGALAVCQRRMRRKDGLFLPVEISYVRLSDGSVCGVVRDITRRKQVERRLTAELAVCKILHRASTFDEAAPLLLAGIGESIHWDFGGLWRADEGGRRFACSHVWQRQRECGAALAAESRNRTFALGEGMIGMSAKTAQPIWITDVFRDASFRRATKVGKNELRSAVAIPISSGKEVAAVLELFSRERREYDAELLELGVQLAAQIGEFAFSRKV
jgi:PAS domain S-box-containing protein